MKLKVAFLAVVLSIVLYIQLFVDLEEVLNLAATETSGQIEQ